MSRIGKLALTLVAFTIFSLNQANANPITLTFDGLQNGERVLDFYNGGFGSFGSGPGPNFGVTFSFNAIVSSPGPLAPRLFFSPTSPAVMNVPGGFVSQLSFEAASFTLSEPTIVVAIFEGLDGTGNLLALTPPIAPGMILQFFSIDFAGTARSVTLGGIAGFGVYDTITFTPAQASAIPEPTTMILLGIGLAGVAGTIRKGRKANKGEGA